MLDIVNKVRAFRKLTKSAGWRAASIFAADRTMTAIGIPSLSTLELRARHAEYPVTARLGGSSDMNSFQQIFVLEEYACLRDIASPRLILDLGANVGYSSAYFLSCFPTAAVVAVEPAPDNFELCRTNLAPYGDRVQVVLGAVWSKRARLVLSRGEFRDGREWSTQVREDDGLSHSATVDGWDIPSLVDLSAEKQIDLLKVDIERSELNVFGANYSSWLPKVRNICIELHGADCKEVFFDALRDYDYELATSGELTVCRNLRVKNVTAH
jgi:FkbM family methyltransferase